MRKAFERQPRRLVAAMYTAQIQCTSEVLGKVYATLARRNGQVLGEGADEGTNLFTVKAQMPVQVQSTLVCAFGQLTESI